MRLIERSSNVFFITPMEAIKRESIISFLNQEKEDVVIITYNDKKSQGASLINEYELLNDSINLSIYNFEKLSEVTHNK